MVHRFWFGFLEGELHPVGPWICSVWSTYICVCFLRSGLAPSFMTKILTRRKMSQYRKINRVKISGRKTVFTILNVVLFGRHEDSCWLRVRSEGLC